VVPAGRLLIFDGDSEGDVAETDVSSRQAAAVMLMPALKTLPQHALPANMAADVEHCGGRANGQILRWPPPQSRAEVNDRHARQRDRMAAITAERGIDIAPGEIASRRAKSVDGMRAEVVHTTRRERFDVRFFAPVHMVVFIEQGVRVAGETSVEGLQRSALRDMRRKVSFVPAGHAYHEWQQPSLLSRAIYFYFDAEKIPLELEPGYSDALREPRLFFEDAALWETAFKLRKLVESPSLDCRICFEALGIILAHELVRSAISSHQSAPLARGGLAAWQQRVLVDYIEENLAQRISLMELAKLVRLSPYHVCRAFKQSFGVPPHRYHTSRRIERAKSLLAKPGCSVTEISLEIGFSETSSFSSAFRKATGLSPTAYHRSLSAVA
jgi:AraC family transcriptional regulator